MSTIEVLQMLNNETLEIERLQAQLDQQRHDNPSDQILQLVMDRAQARLDSRRSINKKLYEKLSTRN